MKSSHKVKRQKIKDFTAATRRIMPNEITYTFHDEAYSMIKIKS